MAIINPEGELMSKGGGRSSRVRRGSKMADMLALSPKHNSWITLTYADFKGLPSRLKKLPFYLKYGHMARAYRLINPYMNSKAEETKKIVAKTMELIITYQDALLKDVEKLTQDKKVDEAYRIALKALEEFKGIRTGFTKKLHEIVREHGSDPGVKNMVQARAAFITAMRYLQSGREKQAVAYLESIAQNYAGNFYGTNASNILKNLKKGKVKSIHKRVGRR